MKKWKIPYIQALPVLIIAFFIFKLIYEAELSFDSVLSAIYSCIAYFVSGFIVAYLLNPALKFFENLIQSKKDTEKMKKLKRGGVIAFLYLLLAGILTIFVVAVIPTIRTGILELRENLPEYTRNLESWFAAFPLKNPELSKTVELWINDLSGFIFSWLQGLDLSSIGDAVTTAVSTSATALIRFVFGLVVSVYFLYSKERLIRGVKKFIYAFFDAKKAENVIETSRKINKIFQNFIVSKLLQSLIIFILGLLVLVPLNMPLAPLLALFIAVTNMIPYFGPYIGAVPSILLVLFYSPIKAFWLLIYAVGVQILDNLIIGPKIMSEQVGISPLFVILGVTIGGTFGGILGMFIGVPIVATAKLVFYDPYIERRLREKGVNAD